MATLGLSKVFILDKYFTELQKFWETEKKLQGEYSRNNKTGISEKSWLVGGDSKQSVAGHTWTGPAPSRRQNSNYGTEPLWDTQVVIAVVVMHQP